MAKQTPKDDRDNAVDFTPMNSTFKDISDGIPVHLHERSAFRSLSYFARDILCIALFWSLATQIDPTFNSIETGWIVTPITIQIARSVTWALFWFFQSLAFMSIWVVGHECGHRAFSDSRHLCDAIGYFAHTFVGTPYFSWKLSHHRHHSYNASMERDEHNVAWTRSELGIPPETSDTHGKHETIDYEDYFGDTPVYSLLILVFQQLVGFPLYLLVNASGQHHYPKWTSHFNPNSILFSRNKTTAIIASNLGILALLSCLWYASTLYGYAAIVKYYLIPWLGVNHWITLIVSLQHTDPRIPRYRLGAWTFTRGAAATIDRPVLGDLGRFFFHDIAHYHVIHHFFPRMPFYHGEEATEYLKGVIGEHYISMDEYVLPALWRNFQECQFVEDEGQVLFYKNKKGKAARRFIE